MRQFIKKTFLIVEGIQLEKEALRLGALWDRRTKLWYTTDIRTFRKVISLDNQLKNKNLQLIGNKSPFILR